MGDPRSVLPAGGHVQSVAAPVQRDAEWLVAPGAWDDIPKTVPPARPPSGLAAIPWALFAFLVIIAVVLGLAWLSWGWVTSPSLLVRIATIGVLTLLTLVSVAGSYEVYRGDLADQTLRWEGEQLINRIRADGLKRADVVAARDTLIELWQLTVRARWASKATATECLRRLMARAEPSDAEVIKNALSKKTNAPAGAPGPAPAVHPDLTDAAARGDLSAIDAALDDGLQIDARNYYAETALFVAVWRERPELVGPLLARGANPNVRVNERKDSVPNQREESTPLKQAIMSGQRRLVDALLAAGADVNFADGAGWTPPARRSVQK